MTFSSLRRVSLPVFVIYLLTFGFFPLGMEVFSLDQKPISKSSTGTTDNVSFVGIKKSKTAQILDNFKKNEDKLLFENAPFNKEEEAYIFEGEQAINNLEEILRRVGESKDSLKQQKQEVTARKFTLEAMLTELEKTMSENEQKISESEEMIREKNRDIAETIRSISDLQDRIESNKQAILDYLSYIYSKSDLIYDEKNEVDVIRTLVLSDGNLSDILSDLHFKSLLEVTGQNFLEERRSLLRDYYIKTTQLKEEKNVIIHIKHSLEARRGELDEQREYKKELLEMTRGREALFNEYIKDRQEKEQKIMDRLTEALENYDEAFQSVATRQGCKLSNSGGVLIDTRSPSKCRELSLHYEAEKNLRTNGFDINLPNPLAWPVQPTYISSYFHDSDYYESVGSSHDAIDIPVPQGTDITAPAPGYIYFINPPTEGGYGYVALKHANGMVTVYGHVSEVLAKKFDFIDSGTVFAKSGGAPGTKGAGVMTSGAHLHFEVYTSHEAVDPLRLLDLTRLRFESLANKYKYKFVEDLKLRYGYLANTAQYNTFKIIGDTEIDRQKYLLKIYASSDFNDWNTWSEEAIGAHIDPSFLMCIGLSETGLGRSLKTPYNIGNIGNTDNGSTSTFLSARDGIYWMGKTLNNKFLGSYTGLNELSRWGNKDKPIYASSPKNWHENMVRCLSALKGRFVEDDYKFRLSPQESDVSIVSTE